MPFGSEAITLTLAGGFQLPRSDEPVIERRPKPTAPTGAERSGAERRHSIRSGGTSSRKRDGGFVDGAPKAVLEKANKEAADKAKAKLEAEGAKVTLK